MKPERLPANQHGLVSQYCIARYAFASQFVKGKIAVDIGCGIGYGAGCLVRGSPRMVIGGDIAREEVEYASAHYKKEESIEFLYLDACHLPFRDNSIDVVTIMDVIEHIQKYQGFLSECKRTLRENGIFICSTPNKEFSSSSSGKLLNPHHTREFNAAELRQLLEQEFKEVIIYGMDGQSKTSQTVYRMIVRIAPGVLAFAPWVWRFMWRVINFGTRFIFRQYRFARIEEVDKLDFSRLDRAHEPFLIQNTSMVPHHILAVAYRERPG